MTGDSAEKFTDSTAAGGGLRVAPTVPNVADLNPAAAPAKAPAAAAAAAPAQPKSSVPPEWLTRDEFNAEIRKQGANGFYYPDLFSDGFEGGRRENPHSLGAVAVGAAVRFLGTPNEHMFEAHNSEITAQGFAFSTRAHSRTATVARLKRDCGRKPGSRPAKTLHGPGL